MRVATTYRQANWKIPYVFRDLANFKHILYCRVSGAMFMPWAPSAAGSLPRRAMAPVIWANWRAIEALLDKQFELREAELRPAGRV